VNKLVFNNESYADVINIGTCLVFYESMGMFSYNTGIRQLSTLLLIPYDNTESNLCNGQCRLCAERQEIAETCPVIFTCW